ncbi:putative membralin [Helianthus annuus]|uniref:Membralin n=1 Tax=Helianthus annuus TaxID=4232 RepID=A0A251S5M6_HELAN|nr:membralin-like protein At1g60995 isoform X2 [Helianthus annuus]KAF5763199.1 putative membralin [Helianthus annuus]KAJ0471889.1 putative membralin [Helianthus annuus]KAJ0647492.1 putative membralin [Helianthus annuus]KAJ0651370.1 putative membralin [Helianthus annuus]KAJ0829944.1 putative membralin [Helianthus annuus]
MDPEQTFIRVQERFSHVLTPRIRASLEYIYLLIAITLFCILVVMHANYVQQPGCSSELTGVATTEAQLIQIKITSAGLWSQSEAPQYIKNNDIDKESVPNDVKDDAQFWSNWLISSSGWSGKSALLKLWRSTKESLKAAILRKWHTRFSFIWRHTSRILASLWDIAGIHLNIDINKCLHVLHLDKINSLAVQWLEMRSDTFEPTYLYTMEKGYFLLPERARTQHNIRTVNISISARDPCFGNRWQQLLINRLVGYDTILMNSLLNSPGQGYLFNYQTSEFYNLTYAHEKPERSANFGDYFATKCGVLMMSLFVFFTTTMSVSFTLRETQTRMLKFTVQLQHHARHRLPTFQLIFVHVIESLVFVPIMIGILFFLFEFYDDQLLAFMVLILVWLCELFTLISVRTPISMKFFPRFFLLYFLVFHIYFFSYTHGFSYLALSTTAAFMLHLILYFWNRFEVPALQRFMQNRRSQFQQQPDFHITSSTILASTLHITRLNPLRNVINNATNPGPTQPQAENDNMNMNRVSDNEGGGAINSFSSTLLWILGGASSEGLNSFLSMFRDQGQENHPTQ